MKKSIMSRESTYIRAVFPKKIIITSLGLVPKWAQRKTVKNTKKRPKFEL